MSNNVIPLGNVTKLDLPVDRVIEHAKGEIAETGTSNGGVVVLGWGKEGELYFASLLRTEATSSG